VSIHFEGIRHSYPERGEVLRGLDLAVGPGEILCLLGPSGCGKTTLLRLAAGLEPLQAGRITLGGQVIAEPGREVPPEARGIGFVFQDYALFPHLTVEDNVAFGLRFTPRGQRKWRIMDALARVGLEAFASAWPHMLSGGQQQRVALARALAPRPKLLLLDEAFASLDARLREQVRDDTLHVLQEAGIATLIVTHDAEEAMFMADRIALMNRGRIEQLGTPAELYLTPGSRFVATFLGEVNRLPARVRGGLAETVIGAARVRGMPAEEGAAIEVLLRPEGLRVLEGAAAAAPLGAGLAGCGAVAEVEACRLLGATTLVHLAVADGQGGLLHLHARLPPGAWLTRGEKVGVAMDPERAFVFPAEAP
jgi:iron(III) transport system ATP-binding protein